MGSVRCSGVKQKGGRCMLKLTPKHGEKKAWCKHHISQAQNQKTESTKTYEECAICLEKVTNVTDARLECGHEFHIDCIKEMHGSKCPMCRAPLKSELIKPEDIRQMEDRGKRDADEVNSDFIREIVQREQTEQLSLDRQRFRHSLDHCSQSLPIVDENSHEYLKRLAQLANLLAFLIMYEIDGDDIVYIIDKAIAYDPNLSVEEACRIYIETFSDTEIIQL